jgi:hypothetical protein
MSDIRRLKEETRSSVIVALLESVEHDHSPSGARDRALVALGLGAASAAGAAAATATTAKAATAGPLVGAGASGVAAKGAAASVAPGTFVKGGALALVKWIGIGVACGGVAIGSVAYVQRRMAPEASTVPASAFAPTRQDRQRTAVSPAGVGARTAPPLPASASPAATTAESSAIPSSPARQAPSPSRSAAPTVDLVEGRAPSSVPLTEPRAAILGAADPSVASSARGPVSAPAPVGVDTPVLPEVAPARDPLSVQLAKLSSIRAALAAHDPSRALTMLADFDRKNPSSALGEEAAVLRIDALFDAGRVGEGKSAASGFLRDHPGSVFADRVRTKSNSP